MLLKMITPPEILPVTLDEAKLHARVEQDEEDALILSQISAATADCEKETRRCAVESTLELVLAAFPAGAIVLPRPPVSSIVSITYKDASGADQTVSDADYELEGNENTAFIIPTSAWPFGKRVRVRYLAGWAVKTGTDVDGNETKTATTPDALKQWILVRTAGLYEKRTNLASATRKIAIPMDRAFMPGLLDGYRLYGPELEI